MRWPIETVPAGVIIALLLSAVSADRRCSSFPPATSPAPLAQYSEAKLGAVASESNICSTIGIDLLRSGGNAADALVGTVFCIGVIGTLADPWTPSLYLPLMTFSL